MTVNDILKCRMLTDPSIQMVGSVWFPTLLLHGDMGQVHPFRDCRSVLVYWYGFVICAVYPKVELIEVNEAARP